MNALRAPELEPRRFEVVKREDIPTIRTVEVGGKEYLLGVLKDFRKDERLAQFMPADSGTSISWTRLEPGEVLEIHTHPVPSMIVICEGTGRTIGDEERDIAEGDVVMVPIGSRHGFVGTGTGFWALSVQFEPRGLYEDPADPWVTFIEEDTPQVVPEDGMAELMARHAQHLDTFLTHPLFLLAHSGRLQAPGVRARLLDCLQVWSTHFQKMVMARVVVSHQPRFAELAQAHQREESGHDHALSMNRRDARPVWDPVLESTASWFVGKMLSLSDLERLVLVHLVVEGAGSVFYREMLPYLSTAETRAHFEPHLDADVEHVAMAVELLQRTPVADWRPLFEIQKRGWAMMRTMLGRMVELATR